jgi:Rod binding domain-containing protein
MTSNPPAAGSPTPADPHTKLRHVAQQLEGVFVAQLFQAMRASVPDGGLTGQEPGGDVFRSMMDDQLANLAAERFQRGIGDALYRQLSTRLDQTMTEGPK